MEVGDIVTISCEGEYFLGEVASLQAPPWGMPAIEFIKRHPRVAWMSGAGIAVRKDKHTGLYWFVDRSDMKKAIRYGLHRKDRRRKRSMVG